MYTENKPRRMSIREFRAALKSDMPLPVIVQSDGEPVFAVMPFKVVQALLDMVKARQARPCPNCGYREK